MEDLQTYRLESIPSITVRSNTDIGDLSNIHMHLRDKAERVQHDLRAIGLLIVYHETEVFSRGNI